MQAYGDPLIYPEMLLTIGETDLFVPEAKGLARTLQNGLRKHFAEATVEWVDCSDLTQEPFNLAAPGLCGDAILLEMGGMSYLFPRPLMPFTYNFKKLLKDLYDNNDVFTIGASIYQRQNGYNLAKKVNNQSYLAFLDEDTGMCALESITNSNPDYYPYGNLFISEGQSGQVLKVQAKKRINMGFLSALQNALYYEYSFNNPRQLVGLGGTFVMKNRRAKHHVLPYSWNARLKAAADIHNWLHYFVLDAPLIAVGTLVSSSEFYKAISRDSKGYRYGISESRFHAFSYQKKLGGHFYMDDRPNNTVEYLGYFYPACMLYHIDPKPTYAGLQDFTDIMKYWQK